MATLYQVVLLYLGTYGSYIPVSLHENDRQLLLSGQLHMTRKIIQTPSSSNQNDFWRMASWTLMSVNPQLFSGLVVGEWKFFGSDGEPGRCFIIVCPFFFGQSSHLSLTKTLAKDHANHVSVFVLEDILLSRVYIWPLQPSCPYLDSRKQLTNMVAWSRLQESIFLPWYCASLSRLAFIIQ